LYAFYRLSKSIINIYGFNGLVLIMRKKKKEIFRFIIMRKLRMGMVGGGQDAFIGAIHRLAANHGWTL
jgi:hypothetical protein